MTALLLQTFLLMVPAFLLGASLACGLRRLMKSQPLAAELPARVPASAVDPLPQYAARDTTVAPALQTPRPDPQMR